MRRESGRCPGKGPIEKAFSLFQFIHSSWELFPFSLFVVVFIRRSFIHKWAPHFCSILCKGGSWRIRKDHYDVGREGKPSSQSRLFVGPQSWPSSSRWSGLGNFPGYQHAKLVACVLVQGWHLKVFPSLGSLEPPGYLIRF